MIDLEKLIPRLVESGVAFVIVGGVAACIHGSAQVTVDLDICYARDKGNLKRLVEALAPFHPRLRGAPSDLPFLWDADTLRQGLSFTLTTDWGDLDLLGEVAGVGDYPRALAASSPTTLFGTTCAVLSLPALIAARRAAGRPRDLISLPELEALWEATKDERER
jgi:hypothetical protein